ncbi:hypothetical protein FNH09_19110 [Streptomyces adustus]|uniref:Uncharacterized protein n=1 Tax=Streptomyces adustus TaxID=1609272 RepID=A0A5N8VGV2_9ACTN|nr:hypothetical protein [Streptomyces adustus]MPY33298.1 hypothetical protein [Streptomyces adustus]
MSGLPPREPREPREIYRVDWLPGTDVLHGTCHCGAEHRAQDPVAMWEWMLGHPEGHQPREDRS